VNESTGQLQQRYRRYQRRKRIEAVIFGTFLTVCAVVYIVALLALASGCAGSHVRTTPAATGAREKTLRITVPAAAPSDTKGTEKCPIPAQPAPKCGDGKIGELNRPVRPGMHAAIVACLLAAPPIDPELLRNAPPGTVFEYTEREASGTGPGLSASGDEVDLSKFNTSAPAAATGAASASGGGMRAAMKLTGGSEGQVVLWGFGAVLLAGGIAACFWCPKFGIPAAAAGGVLLAVAFVIETAPWVIWIAVVAALAVGAVLVLNARGLRLREEGLKTVMLGVEAAPEDSKAEVKQSVRQKAKDAKRSVAATIDAIKRKAGA
jgi:uncharacterized membrane protein